MVNGYGPTETTTFATAYPVRGALAAGRTVPIGMPIQGTSVYVLDDDLNPLPAGAAGDLYIARRRARLREPAGPDRGRVRARSAWRRGGRPHVPQRRRRLLGA